jgi:hypothetical protein
MKMVNRADNHRTSKKKFIFLPKSPQAADSPNSLFLSSKRSGFTLVETLVATAVLMAAIVGSVALITRGLFDFQFSKNKLIATNLAQEGIELVRVIRGNNILCDSLNGAPDHAWDRHPTGGGNMKGDNFSVSVRSLGDMQCNGGGPTIVGATPKLTGGCSAPLLLDSDGTFNYASGEQTFFSRCVHICVPPSTGSACDDAFDPGSDTLGPDGDIPSSEQMDVVSQVFWDEGGRQRIITLHERLYNWK